MFLIVHGEFEWWKLHMVALWKGWYIIPVVMWNLEYCTFVLQCFMQTVIVTQTQRDFHVHFNVARHGVIPYCNTILHWIHNVNTTASLLKKKLPGLTRTVNTPENVERVQIATVQSPSCSRRAALRLCPSTVRKILIFNFIHTSLQYVIN